MQDVRQRPPRTAQFVKPAAARPGVPEAGTIREGIHRIAAAHRVREEPFVTDEENLRLRRARDGDGIRTAVTDGYEMCARRNDGHAA
ncbi:hypothetical protein [Streptomyces lushanensis]|uniref:hypothetical protein n=1 Tax=Streptomyces lushanensis TaxID=1434255 RepID=UPI001FE16DC2|nr:hypothetical protein [Streptomyces lushanensis]